MSNVWESVGTWEVIATFPGMHDYYFIEEGDIIVDDGRHACIAINRDNTPVRVIDWKKYPHLFKKN